MSTFWRLLGFLRPYRRGVVWSLVLATLTVGATVLIPSLVGRDHRPDRRRATATSCRGSRPPSPRRGSCGWSSASCAGWSPARCRSASSTTCATGSTRTCSALELGFFDRQQTGQLMSRATVDLQSVRFFLGYGLVFILQSALTILLAAIAMFVVRPGARRHRAGAGAVRGARRRALRPPLAAGAAGGPAADRRADRRRRGERLRRARRQGLRARGAPARALPRQRRSASSTSRCSPRACARSTTRSSASCPSSAWRRSCFFGGRQVITGSLTLGEFTAFYTYLLMLLGPDAHARHRARDVAARDRLGRAHLPDPRPRAAPDRRPPGAPPLPAGNGRVELRDVTLRYHEGARARAARRRPRRRRPARPSRSSARPGRARRRSCRCCPRLYDVDRGRGPRSTAPTCARSTSRRLRHAIALVTDDPFLFSATVHENIAYARPGRDARGGRAGGPARAGARVHRRPARRATTRSSASAA